jgi:hypothetical protein
MSFKDLKFKNKLFPLYELELFIVLYLFLLFEKYSLFVLL